MYDAVLSRLYAVFVARLPSVREDWPAKLVILTIHSGRTRRLHAGTMTLVVGDDNKPAEASVERGPGLVSNHSPAGYSCVVLVAATERLCILN